MECFAQETLICKWKISWRTVIQGFINPVEYFSRGFEDLKTPIDLGQALRESRWHPFLNRNRVWLIFIRTCWWYPIVNSNRRGSTSRGGNLRVFVDCKYKHDTLQGCDLEYGFPLIHPYFVERACLHLTLLFARTGRVHKYWFSTTSH